MIRSMKTGEERELIPDQDIAPWAFGQLRWSPDGRSILCGGDPVWKNLHLVDVQTGHVTANVVINNCGYIQGPAWSPDGKTLFFTRVRFEKEDWPAPIVALNLETGVERELYPGGSGDGFLAVSPDGRQLAFRDQKDEMIKVLPTEGGEPRTLLDRKDLNLWETGFWASFAWTPDGRYVLFVTGSNEQPGIAQLWRISAEGGIPQKLLEERGMLRPLHIFPSSLHPDGRRIAFQKGRNWHMDLWVMENLLPISTASR